MFLIFSTLKGSEDRRKINSVFVPEMFWWFNTLDWWGSWACAAWDKCGLFLLGGSWKQNVLLDSSLSKTDAIISAVKNRQGFRAQHNSHQTSAICQKNGGRVRRSGLLSTVLVEELIVVRVAGVLMSSFENIDLNTCLRARGLRSSNMLDWTSQNKERASNGAVTLRFLNLLLGQKHL